MAERRRNAFALIELLIGVIVAAMLAVAIIPHFYASTADGGKEELLKYNLHTIRSRVEQYKAAHDGQFPALDYFQGKLPVNPYNNSSILTAVSTAGAGVVAGGAGWQYDESNGTFYPNNREYYEK